MRNRKRRIAEPRFLEYILVLWGIELRDELGEERLVCARGKPRLFVEERKNTEFAFNDIDTGLIVAKINKRPVNLLADVFFLFEFEYMGVELTNVSLSCGLSAETHLLLKLFIRIIDTKLLKPEISSVEWK